MNFSVRVRFDALLRGLRLTGHALAEAVEEKLRRSPRESPAAGAARVRLRERGSEEDLS